MEWLKEKYYKNFDYMMGSFTFEKLTFEILRDFKGWKVTKYDGQTIFYRD